MFHKTTIQYSSIDFGDLDSVKKTVSIGHFYLSVN